MSTFRRLFARLEIDERLLGMVASLIVIWIGFHILSDGKFITPRNLYNLSIQTASVAVMAIGMVLVIVIRQIDLSVGSILGVTAMVIGVLQARWLPPALGLGNPAIWIIAVIAAIVVGGFLGAINGAIIGYLEVPSFVVTLGGLLIWRGCAWWVTYGQTVAPLDQTFLLLGGGAYGTLREWGTWIVAAIGVIAIVIGAQYRRRRQIRFAFPVRPLWAEAAVVGAQCLLVIGFAVRAGYFEFNRSFLISLVKFLIAGAVLAAALWFAARIAAIQFANWSALRDEAVLGVLVVVGAIVYGAAIMALFGPRWLKSLVRA